MKYPESHLFIVPAFVLPMTYNPSKKMLPKGPIFAHYCLYRAVLPKYLIFVHLVNNSDACMIQEKNLFRLIIKLQKILIVTILILFFPFVFNQLLLISIINDQNAEDMSEKALQCQPI